MSEYDWPEDFAHENGNYENKCCKCGSEFVGHKRRPECKKCYITTLQTQLSKYREALKPFINAKAYQPNTARGVADSKFRTINIHVEHIERATKLLKYK